jgi:ribosomal protein L37E
MKQAKKHPLLAKKKLLNTKVTCQDCKISLIVNKKSSTACGLCKSTNVAAVPWT